MVKKNRPLSPHLQIYSFNLPMFVSIFGRACGVASFVSILLLSWVLIIDTFFINQFLITILDNTILSNKKFIFIPSIFVLWAMIFTMFFYFSTLVKHLLMNYNIFIDLKPAKIVNMLCIAFGFASSFLILFAILKNLSQFKYLLSIF